MANSKELPSLPEGYQVPEVWEEPQSMEGTFGSINRRTAGYRCEEELPRGKQDLQIYTLGTANGIKVSIQSLFGQIMSHLIYFILYHFTRSSKL